MRLSVRTSSIPKVMALRYFFFAKEKHPDFRLSSFPASLMVKEKPFVAQIQIEGSLLRRLAASWLLNVKFSARWSGRNDLESVHWPQRLYSQIANSFSGNKIAKKRSLSSLLFFLCAFASRLSLPTQFLMMEKIRSHRDDLNIGDSTCFLLTKWLLLQPDLPALVQGFIPQNQEVLNPGQLTMALGSLARRVMPHNLYLHSSISQSKKRLIGRIRRSRYSCSLCHMGSNIRKLSAAFVVNCSACWF